MIRAFAFAALLALIGCGANGPPEPQRERGPGITISGTATIGVDGAF
ncbi:MAG: hypothetical protein AAF771_02900 [Pseudomonadota bacterium]